MVKGTLQKSAKIASRKKAATPTAGRVAATPADPRKSATTARKRAKAHAPTLLSGGNPQIAKAHGDAPVQAYIAAMPGWKRAVGRRLDSLITHAIPESAGLCKAVKWNSPLYGMEGRGWFLGIHCFTKYVKVAFFRGTSLHPVPPGESRQREMRYLHIHEADLSGIHDAQFTDWVKQAALLPGERM